MTVATIAVTINGREAEIPAGLNIAGLLEHRGVQTTMVAVEHNGRVLRRTEFPGVTVSAGDKLEIVHFVGGGD